MGVTKSQTGLSNGTIMQRIHTYQLFNKHMLKEQMYATESFFFQMYIFSFRLLFLSFKLSSKISYFAHIYRIILSNINILQEHSYFKHMLKHWLDCSRWHFSIWTFPKENISDFITKSMGKQNLIFKDLSTSKWSRMHLFYKIMDISFSFQKYP